MTVVRVVTIEDRLAEMREQIAAMKAGHRRHDAEIEPRCDICGEPEDHEPGFIEYDWNGDTGCHLSCEAGQRR